MLQDRSKLRDLRMALREGMHRLFADKRFRVFEKPVDPTEVPDYYQVIERPICLDQILQRIDDHWYAHHTTHHTHPLTPSLLQLLLALAVPGRHVLAREQREGVQSRTQRPTARDI